MNKMTEMAVQQLTGFIHGVEGHGILNLCISMGLTEKEWKEISRTQTWIHQKYKQEIDEFFYTK